MPNKNIFCNVPWYDLHIYWDGSLGICCNESHKLYAETRHEYNIARMSIRDWYNSEPVRKFRLGIQGDQQLSLCRGCYLEEQHGGGSRRIKENQKSAIFTQAFEHSVVQSPGYQHFAHSIHHDGYTNTMPIDLHVNLGNFCNLACKMCWRGASSKIASQEVKWGIADSKTYLGVDWTKDQSVWEHFIQQLLNIKGLNNIHFMGGETLLTDRFEDLVDAMILHEKFDLCFSFVTNGTVFKPELLDKLKLFKRVGIEVSIETLTAHNSYQRQGTDTSLVLHHIDRYLEWCNGSSITLALRPAPSSLTIGYYYTLLEYAIEKQMTVKSNLCYSPKFLYAVNLPTLVKTQYAENYVKLISRLPQDTTDADFNASDPNNFLINIKQEAEMCLQLLQEPTPADAEQQLQEMVQHCRKWDQIYQLDARKLYPELSEVWSRYAY